jgi:flagellar basal-body rod protein FlgB
MDLTKMPLFSLMARRMDWLTQRETVLAQNIANADSPEYRARDLTPASFREMLQPSVPRVQLVADEPAHILPPKAGPASFRDAKSKKVYETSLDGNAVSLEEQMMKVSETQGDYRLVTNLFEKQVSMLKQAIGRSQ